MSHLNPVPWLVELDRFYCIAHVMKRLLSNTYIWGLRASLQAQWRAGGMRSAGGTASVDAASVAVSRTTCGAPTGATVSTVSIEEYDCLIKIYTKQLFPDIRHPARWPIG